MIIDFNASTGSHEYLTRNYTMEQASRDLREAGIDAAVISHINSTSGSEPMERFDSADGLQIIRFAGFGVNFSADGLVGNSISGIRVYPTYLSYDLEGDAWRSVLELACDNQWAIHFSLRLLDPRVMPQQIPTATALAQIENSIREHKNIRFVIGGLTLSEIGTHLHLFKSENIWTEISHIQHPINSLSKAVETLGSEKLLFGSNYPFFYPYAAVFRVLNSGLSDTDKSRILEENARTVLSQSLKSL